MLLLALLVVAGAVIYFMKPEERMDALRKGVAFLRDAKTAVDKRNAAEDPFRDALHERTARILVTPFLVALNVFAYLRLLFGSGSLSDPATLVAAGANLGTSTTNGEWWRLLTSLFVHDSFFALVVSMAVLFALGVVLERIVGHITFAAVFLVSGVIASMVRVAMEPLVVASGSTGAIFGLCGLLIATLIRGFFHKSPLTIPLHAIKVLGPVAGVYMLVAVMGSGSPGRAANVTALGVGLLAAAILVRDLAEPKPAGRRVAAVAAAAMVVCFLSAIPLAGITDIRKEIDGVLAFEERTAQAYDAAVVQFRKGWIKADALVALIDGKIRPELASLRSKLNAIKGMPREQQMLATRAEEYFRLRDESWRLRSQALLPPNARGLRTADTAERASLDVLQEVRESDARQ